MPESQEARNPTWSRDELILTLDLYFQFKGNPPGKTSENILELSDLLNKMGAQIADRKADFRNPNGVYMKVMNFRRFDPIYISQGKKGLQKVESSKRTFGTILPLILIGYPKQPRLFVSL
jgi:5-methylcytosine-specific restriction enzyme A